MSSETKERFPGVSESDKKQIVTMPSLFMDENHQYGNADAEQKAIYGFVPDYKIYDNEVKVYWCGCRLDIPQIDNRCVRTVVKTQHAECRACQNGGES